MEGSKLETAGKLAKAHFRVDQQVRHIHLIQPMHDLDPNEPIKLLEVVEGTIERGIEPIAFTADPARGIEFPSVIVEVSPREYEKLHENGNVLLGFEDWEVGEELSA